MTEIGLKDIEKSFATEHDYIRERLGHVLDDIHGVKNLVRDENNKRKKYEMEEDKPATECSDVEEENPKTGAQINDMNKFQRDEVKKWLEDNPDRKAESMIIFDKTLMNDKAKVLPASLELLSG
eukprot:6258425-Heterocapsa_arctica.AAC.1